ncbi:hypothetical protein GRAN_1490 [Granulicella sibirica]|uniref:Uncharacterized protein n=1 Tax=Granulicella sibirica TaxID=2479048 RepID=A0A4Q0T6B4_9BACT|nr:hypothetical protein GRAN_1490 [Granulicella sibirica]
MRPLRASAGGLFRAIELIALWQDHNAPAVPNGIHGVSSGAQARKGDGMNDADYQHGARRPTFNANLH